MEKFGALDILVNSIGLDGNKKNLVKFKPDEEKLIGYSEMSEIMNINLLGYLQTIGYSV
jgi:hypothetical protein